MGRTGGAILLVALAVQAMSFFLYAPHIGPLFLKKDTRLHRTYWPLLCKNPFTRTPVGSPRFATASSRRSLRIASA